MKLLINSLLLFALISMSLAANAVKPGCASLESPCFITFLDAGQIAPSTARVDWLSSVDGPFDIEVMDLATNQIAFQTVSFNNSEVIPNLPNGDYVVTVTDIDNDDSIKFSIN